jgi:uncharacterized repeat protein (TIGR03806 family)
MNRIISPLCLILFLVLPVLPQAPYGLPKRVPNASFLPSSSGYALGEMRLRRVFAGISLSQPVFLTHAGDGSDRIFVVERAGRVLVFPNRDDVDTSTLFLDLRDAINSGPGEAGLLSIAFHPRYAANGLFYIYYTYGGLISRISEFHVSDGDPNRADIASERILLEVRQPAGNHNGGQVTFGPDGYLYVGLGDGGAADDRYKNGQDPTTLLGSILRIDVDRTDAGLEYAIPPDNPFIDHPDGWREEIWAWGLRNPWRFSFDPLTGDLWTGDVGQNRWEEIDRIEKGGNYGWNIMEGSHCFRPSTDCQTDGLILPIAEYEHSAGRSVTGGYVYRGSRLIRLQGIYLYGDFVTRTIWGLRYADGRSTENQVVAHSPSPIASFGEDESGEVYVVGYDGRIYLFDEPPDAPSPGEIPATISSSGLYADVVRQIPSPGIVPYSVNSQLWSDGAHKTRFIALPGTEQIEFSRDGNWIFSPGATLVKNFYLELEKGDPASRHIVETRFLIKRETGEAWDGFSYRWNEEGTDAVLLEGSDTRTFTIADPDALGDSYEYDYYFPSRAECNACHTPATGYVLGVHTAQLNRPHDYGGSTDNQFRALGHAGFFTRDIGGEFVGFPRLSDPLDESADLETRARSYLDANCSSCHLPGGTGRVDLDLRFSTPLDDTGLIDVTVTLDNLDIPGAIRIAPGDPDRSILYHRMLDTGRRRMPPLATSRIDRKGAAVIRRWIEAQGDPTSISVDAAATPSSFHLEQNFPNPFNPLTTIRFTLSHPSHIRLELFDLLGQRLDLLTDGFLRAGPHQILFNAAHLSSGVYIYRLTSDSEERTLKMLLLK